MPIIPVEQGRSWPSGIYQVIAELTVDESWISTVFQQSLVEGHEDGLGPWVGAGGMLPSGELVEVVKYLWQPGVPSFQLRIDEQSSRDKAIKEFVRETGIPLTEITVQPAGPLS
jgi:hypothetical protein